MLYCNHKVTTKTVYSMLYCESKVLVEYIPVSPFVVIPRNKFHKVFIQSNSCLGIKYARPEI